MCPLTLVIEDTRGQGKDRGNQRPGDHWLVLCCHREEHSEWRCVAPVSLLGIWMTHLLIAGIPKVSHGIFKLRINSLISLQMNWYHWKGPLASWTTGFTQLQDFVFLKALSDIIETSRSQHLVLHLYNKLYFEKHIHGHLPPGIICLCYVVSLVFLFRLSTLEKGPVLSFCIHH